LRRLVSLAKLILNAFPRTSSSPPCPPRVDAVADRLHSAAIRLLRRLRAEDRASDLSGPRLSALSVVVFAGPIALSALAEAEQVRLPSMSRLVRGLEQAGLVERVPDASDRRVQWLRATPRGRKVLQEGRARRVARLTRELATLPTHDLAVLCRAAATLERLFGAPPAPIVPRR